MYKIGNSFIFYFFSKVLWIRQSHVAIATNRLHSQMAREVSTKAKISLHQGDVKIAVR